MRKFSPEQDLEINIQPDINREPNQQIIRIASIDDIPKEKNLEVHTVRLMRTNTVTRGIFSLLIDKYPNLRLITVSPSIFKSYFEKRKLYFDFLIQNHIEVGMHKSGETTSVELPSFAYRTQRKLYAEIFMTAENRTEQQKDARDILQILDKYNVINLTLLEAYLGAEPTTLPKVSADFDIPLPELVVEINAMLIHMGDGKNKSAADQQRAGEMIAQLRKNGLSKAEKPTEK